MAEAPKTPEQVKKEQEERIKADQAKRDAENKQSQSQTARPQAKTAGGTSTYNAQRGSPQDLADPRGDTFLTRDEIKSLAGDIISGELGLLKLDEEGHPTGTVIKGSEILKARHNPDDFFTTVISPVVPPVDEIVTPSGAPVTKYMNPDPVLWDAGMLARNPPPEPTEQDEKYAPVVGGGVVNQPVRV